MLSQQQIEEQLNARDDLASVYLAELARRDDLSDESIVAQGIRWADESCRISGTLSMAIRKADRQCGVELVKLLLRYGARTQNDVPRIMNQYYHTVLKVLNYH